MEPIKLRGHHIELVQRYATMFKGRVPSSDDFESVYGKDYAKNYSELCKKIIEGKYPVIIVDTYDDFCRSCRCKNNGGCLHKEYFEPEMSVSQADAKISERYGMKTGIIYNGDVFLRMINGI